MAGRVVWKEWMDAVMREKFAETENSELVRELGVSLRTVERKARELGLRKSEEHRLAMQRRAAREGERWFEYMRITGQKVKKKRVGGKAWEKGHRFEGEIEERRVAAIRQTAWEERVRMMHGMTRRTKWKMRLD